MFLIWINLSTILTYKLGSTKSVNPPFRENFILKSRNLNHYRQFDWLDICVSLKCILFNTTANSIFVAGWLEMVIQIRDFQPTSHKNGIGIRVKQNTFQGHTNV